MLSRLNRKAETLDGVCLRAWGHPNDPAIRQELLDALKWDSSLHPDHAHPSIRDLFKLVHDHSVSLSNGIRSAANNPDSAAHLISRGVEILRQYLAALMKILAARRGS